MRYAVTFYIEFDYCTDNGPYARCIYARVRNGDEMTKLQKATSSDGSASEMDRMEYSRIRQAALIFAEYTGLARKLLFVSLND